MNALDGHLEMRVFNLGWRALGATSEIRARQLMGPPRLAAGEAGVLINGA